MTKRKTGLVVASMVLAGALAVGYAYVIDCEGRYRGPVEEDTWVADGRLAALEADLRTDVAYLSRTLGPRNPGHYDALQAAADWIRTTWRDQGYSVQEQVFAVGGRPYVNLVVEIPGRRRPQEVVLVTAQYDTWPDSPGANNNASGMAVLTHLSRQLRDVAPDRTLRFAAFSLQEPPWNELGSRIYADSCRRRGEDIRVMLSMDSIGIYKHEPGSQRLPFPFSLLYPDRGDFLAFIADLGTRPRVVAATRGFKRGSRFPLATASVPRWVEGASWSDHHAFWDEGYRAIQITDTGSFRSPTHTNAGDVMDLIDFAALARITVGMSGALRELASVDTD